MEIPEKIYIVIGMFDGVINNVSICFSEEDTKKKYEEEVDHECTYDQYIHEEAEEILSSGKNAGTQVWEFSLNELLKKRV